tara:strand:- start:23 stop:319 length:297 start_codon:yes stop_codon:yes gene_type:complete
VFNQKQQYDKMKREGNFNGHVQEAQQPSSKKAGKTSAAKVGDKRTLNEAKGSSSTPSKTAAKEAPPQIMPQTKKQVGDSSSITSLSDDGGANDASSSI